MHINYKNISIERIIVLLAKNGIHIDDSEAIMILEFLNLISKNYQKPLSKRQRKP
ncbi:PTS sugar transporter subunit IIBC [Elizabethkingia anophelis]|nr:PTS sugar transporter subunit IIBC [Elizabethkingia anophelis]